MAGVPSRQVGEERGKMPGDHSVAAVAGPGKGDFRDADICI